MKDISVIVFGGSGFLGSHVVDALSEAGFKVKVFDCTPSPYIRADQEMIVGDILNPEAVMKAAKGCKFVYNFAALADMDDARDKPQVTANLNIIGNLNVLEAAREAKAERFIFASSIYVYSTAGSFYRVSKQAAEGFVEAYQERFGLDYTILRYGSLYGRRADDRNAIFGFLKQALHEKTITYRGSPDSMREYIHVSDAAKLSVQILKKEYVNRHIILTGHERMAVKNLLKMISEMVHGIDIRYSTVPAYGHYEMTPYSFSPKIGHKLVANDYVDLGQGLLDCLREISEQGHVKLDSSEQVIRPIGENGDPTKI